MNRKFDTTAGNQHFAKMLCKAMSRANWASRDLASASGVSKSMINKLRKGEHSPTLDMILSINAGFAEHGHDGVWWILQRKVPDAVRHSAEPASEPAKSEPPMGCPLAI